MELFNKLKYANKNPNFTQIFANSSIISSPEREMLYFNLPLSDKWAPSTEKVFSWDENSPNTIEKLLTLMEKSENDVPNIILIMNDSNDEKFGGYSSSAWKINE